MLQDIKPHKFDNSFKKFNACKSDYILFFNEETVFLKNTKLPSMCDMLDIAAKEDLIYLSSIDEKRFFTFLPSNNFDFKKLNLEEVDVKIFREFEPKWEAFALITGFSLYKWYLAHRFCGRCGSSTKHSTIERAIVCPECNNIEYPKISPAVIVAIYDKDRLLMTKYSKRSYKKYALIAGYAEVGETLEEAAKREVMEEVGLKIKNLKYFNSQPWAASESLLVGFFAELEGDDTIKLDEDELKEATWIKRQDIMADDTTLSLTWEMIEHFKFNAF